MKNIKSFTIMELLVVIIIIGILSTLAVSQYGTYREKVLDREAQANLRLIAAAERVRRMESDNNQYIGCDTNNDVRANLRVDVTPTDSGPNWSYQVIVNAAKTNFCAQATRNSGNNRQWNIKPATATTDPQPTTGACGTVT